jgi:hypothetical protein
MKAGLTVVSTTAALTRAGVVYVLNTDQRVSIPVNLNVLTYTQCSDFFATIRAHPDCVAYGAEHFRELKEFHCHTVDNITYETFQPYEGTLDTTGFGQHVFAIQGQPKTHRPMSTIFMIFDRTATPQDYMVSARGSFYTRWPLNTLGGQVATDIPVISEKKYDAANQKAKAESAQAGGNRRR